MSGIKQEALREVAMLRVLDHPNIIKLLDVIYAKTKVTLVLEYVPRDLLKVISDLAAEGSSIPPADIKSYMR